MLKIYEPFFKSRFAFQEVSESRSVLSDILCPHGLYSPWNSPDQNTGVISFSHPGIKLRSPAWQVDSLPAEPQGKPAFQESSWLIMLPRPSSH